MPPVNRSPASSKGTLPCLITISRKTQPPVHIIFLLDILNNSFQDIARQLRAVEKYLDQNREQLSFPVSIAVLTESGINLGQPSRHGKALIGQLKKVHAPLATIGSPEGSNAGRFHLSVQSLTKLVTDQEDVPGRVLLIWMGPGWPLLSDGPYPGTPMDKRNFFAEVLNLSTGFLDAQMTMDTISSPNLMRETTANFKPFLKGAQRADRIPESLVLQQKTTDPGRRYRQMRSGSGVVLCALLRLASCLSGHRVPRTADHE